MQGGFALGFSRQTRPTVTIDPWLPAHFKVPGRQLKRPPGAQGIGPLPHRRAGQGRGTYPGRHICLIRSGQEEQA